MPSLASLPNKQPRCSHWLTKTFSPRAMADRRHFKGALRPHAEAVALDVIDLRIHALVRLQRCRRRVISTSSCQGHRLWPCADCQTPFVMIRCDAVRTAWLAAIIRADQMTAVSRLHHYWKLGARFLDDDQLVFCLNSPERRYSRRKLDADFAQLTSWVQELFQAR